MTKSIENLYVDIEAAKGASDRVAAGLKYHYYSYLNILDVKRLQLKKSLDALVLSPADPSQEALMNVVHKTIELKHLLNKVNRLII